MGGISLRRVVPGWMLIGAATLVGPNSPASAATAAPTTANKAPAAPKKTIDPNVMAAFSKMGAFLRTLTHLQLSAETTIDEVTETGQKIQYGGTFQIYARRPDRLRIDVSADRMRRQFFYDGKTFTQYDADSGFYAQFAAPPTIGEVVDAVEKHYGIELPLTDLFYWGTDKFDVEQIRSAINVGPSRVNGADCDHYAFRQKDVDWQVWVARGPQPVPMKLVITTTSERTEPQHTSVLTWDLGAKPQSDAAFQFVPPQGAHRIDFQTNKSK